MFSFIHAVFRSSSEILQFKKDSLCVVFSLDEPYLHVYIIYISTLLNVYNNIMYATEPLKASLRGHKKSVVLAEVLSGYDNTWQNLESP